VQPKTQDLKPKTNSKNWQLTTGNRQPATGNCLSAFPVHALWTIPAAHSSRFSSLHFLYTKTAVIQRSNDTLLSIFVNPADARKFVAAFFLNCTNNTELTRAHFARTVTLLS
jgi:hypothetical protein